jgi:uncharacterized phage-like protein YoqJ
MNIGDRVTSVCFTGHRDLTNIEIQNASMRLSKLLSVLIEHHGLKECFAGGAVGFDTVAAQTVLSLKSYYPELKLNLILPCHGQENSWNANQKSEYYHIKDHADQVRVLAPFFYNGCMHARNRELLNNADICIAYLRKGTSSGGSLNTVLQATKLGIPVINIADEESEIIQ